MDYVKEYDEVVSYFTIGPSIGKEEEVTHLVKQISMDKLLMESDGIEAVKWAIDSDDYLAALNNEITMVALLKNQSYSEVELFKINKKIGEFLLLCKTVIELSFYLFFIHILSNKDQLIDSISILFIPVLS